MGEIENDTCVIGFASYILVVLTSVFSDLIARMSGVTLSWMASIPLSKNKRKKLKCGIQYKAVVLAFIRICLQL
jgi:hypothetical protein